MSRLRMLQVWMATVVLSTGLAVVPGMAAGSTQTFTGKVSDAMCGAKHMEGGIAPAACVRACWSAGATARRPCTSWPRSSGHTARTCR